MKNAFKTIKNLLYVGPDGTPSANRLWKNIGNCIASVLMVKHCWFTELSWELLTAYVSLMGSQYLIGKYLGIKGNIKGDTDRS